MLRRKKLNKYGFEEEGGKVLKFDFVLVSDHEARELRERMRKKPWPMLGVHARTEGGLPVADLRSETEI